MRCWVRVGVAAMCLGAGLGTRAQGVAATGTSLAFQRAEHLRRGLNLSGWYAQTRDFSASRMDGYMSVAEMQQLKRMGFDHVRLSVDPEALIAEAATGALRDERMARLDRTVNELTGAGLNVILDIHAEESWKAPMTHGDEWLLRFCAFWRQFARHYAKTDPEHVFFEVLNEPSMEDISRWGGMQARAVAAIRQAAPRHTVIATAASWGHQDGLLAMEPVRDEDVIYTFHDYDPMWFTHQGATWSTAEYAVLHGVPYPSTPENIQTLLGQELDERVRLQLQRYGFDRWNAQRVGMEVAVVSEWAARRGVPLYCGEFGVFKTYAEPKARAMWISDTRTALESKHIGWAMWDWDGNFGLVTKEMGAVVVDQDVLHALGM